MGLCNPLGFKYHDSGSYWCCWKEAGSMPTSKSACADKVSVNPHKQTRVELQPQSYTSPYSPLEEKIKSKIWLNSKLGETFKVERVFFGSFWLVLWGVTKADHSHHIFFLHRLYNGCLSWQNPPQFSPGLRSLRNIARGSRWVTIPLPEPLTHPKKFKKKSLSLWKTITMVIQNERIKYWLFLSSFWLSKIIILTYIIYNIIITYNFK